MCGMQMNKAINRNPLILVKFLLVIAQAHFIFLKKTLAIADEMS